MKFSNAFLTGPTFCVLCLKLLLTLNTTLLADYPQPSQHKLKYTNMLRDSLGIPSKRWFEVQFCPFFFAIHFIKSLLVLFCFTSFFAQQKGIKAAVVTPPLVKKIVYFYFQFETRNRVQKNRESKDADRINDLLKKNEELKNENQNAKSENEAMREHIESFSSIIQKQVQTFLAQP